MDILDYYDNRHEQTVQWREAGLTFVEIAKRLGVSGCRSRQIYQRGLRKRHRMGRVLVNEFNGEKQRHALERMEAAIEAGTWVPKSRSIKCVG